MDFSTIFEQLDGAADALSMQWPMQNNDMDNTTKFIYSMDSFAKLEHEMTVRGLSDKERQYALHRWYNWKTSEVCESIFIEYGARKASKEENLTSHIDVYIDKVPYDIKLSVFPKKLENNSHLNLKLRRDRDKLIRWFYYNQSVEQRNYFNNRIFVVCNGRTVMERYSRKQDFDQMELKISTLMNAWHSKTPEINGLDVTDIKGTMHNVRSEIICIDSNSSKLKDKINNDVCPICNSPLELKVARKEGYVGNVIIKCTNCYNYWENV